ncbi:MAG: tRNA preQ1(34) S-adenosylmethionine ribosyltransferase-isomerase QueA [Parachlamydiaceae bacterium]
MNIYDLNSYHFELPESLIAQEPVYPRDHSRLMIVNRKSGQISEIVFKDLKQLLSPGDRLIFNNTKVIPARLLGHKETGARIEILLSRARGGEHLWEVMARPAKKLSCGTKITFSDSLYAKVVDKMADGLLIVKFFPKKTFREELEEIGQLPLPHYIKRNELSDIKDYQTVYAKNEGAVAAPTAGLHFTEQLINELRLTGINLYELTLHVGLGTFKPVQVEDIRTHHMHREFLEVSEETADLLNRPLNHSLEIAVGTTSCRALESAALDGKIQPGQYETDLFIYPGYQFKYVKALLTNFHLPGSSLLMLVSAFGGYNLIREAYQKAVKDQFRFFSYGDAMLII